MDRDKVVRALGRRPRGGDFRSHLFWLVDVIYVCKAVQDAEVRAQAGLLEQALGSLGQFVETGEPAQLAATQAALAAFHSFITGTPRAAGVQPPAQAGA